MSQNPTEYEVIFGRLGRPPELRRTQEGGFVCDFSVAINQGKDQPPIWKRVVTWGEVAQQCKQKLSKGSEIFIRGRCQIKSFQNQQGQTKTYEEVSAHLIGFTNI